MALLDDIKKANPLVKANDAFIQAVFRQKYGRAATQKDINDIIARSKTGLVKDISNIILGKDSPFQGTVSGGPAAIATPGGYQGNGGKWGELPKKDSSGKLQWIGPDGQIHVQPGYDPNTGSWDYLGQRSSSQFTAAESVYKSLPPLSLDTPFANLPDSQKLDFLNQAHQELSRNFVTSVAQGQADAAYEAGQAIQSFARAIEENNLGMSEDIRKTQLALEAAGLTFQGEGKRQLGEGFAGAGVLTPEQQNIILSNLSSINALPGTAQVPGQGIPSMSQMPTPAGPGGEAYGTPEWNALSMDQRDKAWQDLRSTAQWQDYTRQLNTMATSGTGEGIAGTGQYGFTGNLDPYARTGIGAPAQGSVFWNQYGTGRTQVAESARRDLGSRARSLGTTAEQLLGTTNIPFLGSIGGQNILNPAANVLGEIQSGYQTNTGARAGEFYGNAVSQNALTFSI